MLGSNYHKRYRRVQIQERFFPFHPKPVVAHADGTPGNEVTEYSAHVAQISWGSGTDVACVFSAPGRPLFSCRQEASLMGWGKTGWFSPFLGKGAPERDSPEKCPFQTQRSCCRWSMRRKYFQCCLNMLFRSIARKMATWIRRGVGRGGKSLDSTLTSSANAGFFSASTEAQLEITFIVFCALHTLL